MPIHYVQFTTLLLPYYRCAVMRALTYSGNSTDGHALAELGLTRSCPEPEDVKLPLTTKRYSRIITVVFTPFLRVYIQTSQHVERRIVPGVRLPCIGLAR